MSSYKDAGVDIERGNESLQRIRKHVETTFTDKVLQNFGSFAGAFDASELKNMEKPVLLSTVDGVGTKTSFAAAMNKWEGIGLDIVHHCANDLVCQGASPLLFLDYIASSKVNPQVVEDLVAGMAAACKVLECVLIGGETAEMPKVYYEHAQDVVGSMIGIAERDKMITGESIEEGDQLIALPSNGLHTNGYSLARKVLLEDAEMDLWKKTGDLSCPLGEALLLPHTSYSPLVLQIHQSLTIKGVAHITGGGISGNLSRILPKGTGATVQKKEIKTPPIFTLIQEKGKIAEEEMFKTFNMGVGMILVVAKGDTDTVLKKAEGSYKVGEVIEEKGIHIQ